MGFSLGSIVKPVFSPVKRIFGGAIKHPLKTIGGALIGGSLGGGSLSKSLFGSPDKLQWTDPRKMIAPPSWQEEGLLGKLYPIAQRELSNYYNIDRLLNSPLGQINYTTPIRNISYTTPIRNIPDLFHRRFPRHRLPSRPTAQGMIIGTIGDLQRNNNVHKHKGGWLRRALNLYKTYNRYASPIRRNNGTLLTTSLSEFGKRYGQTLNKLDALSNAATGLLNSPEMWQARRTAFGELPFSFEQMIQNHFQNQMGGILNETAKRGIVNSSITQKAIADALQNTFNERAKYLPIAQELALTPLKAKAGLLPLAENLTLQPVKFAVDAPLGLFGSLRDIQKDYIAYPANLWNSLMTARHGVVAQPIVRKGSGGLLGAMMPALGSGLGFAIGGPLGGAMGGWLGGLFNR